MTDDNVGALPKMKSSFNRGATPQQVKTGGTCVSGFLRSYKDTVAKLSLNTLVERARHKVLSFLRN